MLGKASAGRGVSGWLAEFEQIRQGMAAWSGVWTLVLVGAMALVCVTLLILVRRGRRVPESAPVVTGASAGALALSMVRDDEVAHARAAVMALREALRAPGRAGSGALARVVRLEEQGEFLTEAVIAATSLSRNRFGAGRRALPALSALAGGDVAPIRDMLATVSQTGGDTEDVLRHLAAVWLVEDPQQALASARRATALAPRCLAAWSVLALAAHETGALDQARDACETVLKLGTGPDDRSMVAGALGTLGEVHQALGAFERAEDYLRIALTYQAGLARPDSMIRLYLQLSRLHEARGDWNQAADILARALALESQLGRAEGMADLEIQAGDLAKRRGRLPEACSHWVRARQLLQAKGHVTRAAEIDAMITAALRDGR